MAAAAALHAPMMRVAAVWGTTVLELRTLKSGQSFALGEHAVAGPEGVELPDVPVRSAQGGWEIDPRGALGGVVRLRGRDEDPVALGRAGAGVAIVPGDYGVLQYGLFSVFFQYSNGVQPAKKRFGLELLPLLAIVSSLILHFGTFGMLGALSTPPVIPKPLELTTSEEFAARFRVKRADLEEPPPLTGGNDKGAGVKDPGLKDKTPQGGGQKMKGAEGKLGLKGDRDKTELPGDVKPATNLGGLSEVLDSTTGKEIRSTLETIKSVSEALGGLSARDIVIGGGTGSGLRGGGAGGGGTGAGVPFGAGNLQTGAGLGAAGGLGAGAGGLGRAGAGGHGRGGAGGAGGAGAPGEARVAVAAATPAAKGGLSPEQVRRVVIKHAGALRACYESEAAKNPSLKGGISVAWQIDPSGSVSGAQLKQSSLSNPRVEGCVLRQIKSWSFPATDSPTTVAEYPFRFGVGG